MGRNNKDISNFSRHYGGTDGQRGFVCKYSSCEFNSHSGRMIIGTYRYR